MNAVSLFDYALARRSDPETSHAAASTVRVSELQRRVLDAIRELDGEATIEAVADHTGLSLVSVSPRFKPLAKMGKIYDTGRRATNRSGRSAVLWGLL